MAEESDDFTKLLNVDDEVRAKYEELLTIEGLTADERAKQLADFINARSNDDTLGGFLEKFKLQKKSKIPKKMSIAEKKHDMKMYLKNQMHLSLEQMKGKSYGEIQIAYLKAFERDQGYKAIDYDDV